MARREPRYAVYTHGSAPGVFCRYCDVRLDNPRSGQVFCGASTGRRCRHLWHRRERARGKPHLCACGEPHVVAPRPPKKPRPRRKECEEAKALREMSRDEMHLHRSRCKECRKEAR